MNRQLVFTITLLIGTFACSQAQTGQVNLSDYKRILFLGDSITHAGHYVSYIETWLRQNNKCLPEMIQVGLPSETCSGLSEPEHPWPRPNVHERLARALEKTKPDLVFACYGMNDGIYYPFSEERFAKYKKCLEKLISDVHQSGAELVLLTPPPFDPHKLKGTKKLRPLGAETYAWFAIYEGYDDVIKKYSQHVLSQKCDDRVLTTVDFHSAVTDASTQIRKKTPDFSYYPDGVHLNSAGHKDMATAIMQELKLTDSLDDLDEQLYKLVHERQTLLHYSWLTHIGHKRPSTKAGIPLPEAKKQAEILEKKIQDHLHGK